MCKPYFPCLWLSRMILVQCPISSLNCAAVDVSPRHNISRNRHPSREVCADSRLRLRFGVSTCHLTPALSPNSVGGEGESSSALQQIELSFGRRPGDGDCNWDTRTSGSVPMRFLLRGAKARLRAGQNAHSIFPLFARVARGGSLRSVIAGGVFPDIFRASLRRGRTFT
jgi:hypothetical protein